GPVRAIEQSPLLLSRSSPGHPPGFHSFPTRRSSDLPDPCRRSRFSAGARGRETGSMARFRRRVLGRGRYFGGRAGNNHRPMEARSEEHTSELQSRENLVCRLLLEKKKTRKASAATLH